MRKPVFRVSHQLLHKPDCTGQMLEILDSGRRGIVLSMKQNVGADQLCGAALICTFVYASAKSRFSHDMAH